jgi:hypothetical protein
MITPLAYLGYHGTVDKAPFDHINGAEAMRTFVGRLPRGEDDYLDALRAYTDTCTAHAGAQRAALLSRQDARLRHRAAVPEQAVPDGQVRGADAPSTVGDEQLRQQLLPGQLARGARLQSHRRALRARDGQLPAQAGGATLAGRLRGAGEEP